MKVRKKAALVVGILALVVCAELVREHAASMRGRLTARYDDWRGHYVVLAYGLPSPWRPQYAQLLRERYDVEVQTVALCIVSKTLRSYADSYDEVSAAAANHKFGHDVFKECDEVARWQWELPGTKFFIDTAVEWRALAGDLPQRFERSELPIYGATSLVALFDGGKMALLSGYFNYVPKRKGFQFTPGEGFSVQIGKWEKTEGNQLRVEYRFALGEKLACPLGSQSDENCYGFRYRQPATVGTWSAATNGGGQFTTIDAPSTGEGARRRYSVLLRLENRREVLQILKFAEKNLLEHVNADTPNR